ncbi:SusD/RagB family nutrient-binding outer membrane lipoprotein [Sphingobacterium pedocola]|nr:SusD/RagB family nutrient-binding outer membrane lipoprotein [Sphingobacterium pedocola]
MYKYITKSALAMILLATSCTKGFDEINTNPLLLQQSFVKTEDIFTYVAKRFSFEIHSHQYRISSYSGYYTNPAGGNLFSNNNWANPHNNFYRQYYINASELVRMTRDNPAKNDQNAIARILKAMIFQHLTDLYGDLPYFQAALGVNTTILQPFYDKQEDIYYDLLKEVKEATAALGTVPDQQSLGNNDLYFQGNIDKWKKLGNSLRLRMAMRIRYASPQVAAEHINEATYEPLILTNSDNMFVKTLNDGVEENQNSLYTKSVTLPGNMRVSFTTTDLLGKLNDPRLPIFAKPAELTGDYLGLPLQLLDESGSYSGGNISLMSDMFLQPVFDIVMLNAAEVSFLRAEAANAGVTNENAQTYFANGIRLSMAQYGVPVSDINDYLASPAGTLTGTEEEKLEQIINQKWIGNYYNHYESYAEFRRTGYPRIWTGESLGVTNGEIPRRLTYPDEEYQRNEANVIEASNRMQGGNLLTSRIWWDKKAGLPFHHPRQGMLPTEGI